MRSGVLRGETVDQLARRVRGTKANGFKDGVMQASRAQATALVRTSVQTVSNAARAEVFNANKDVIRGQQHLSTLDPRTCPICRPIDNAAWDLTGAPLPDSPYKGPNPGRPPLHWQCRCVRMPVLRPIEELVNIVGPRKAGALDALPPSTRASMNGQVAADLTYEEWLNGKSEAAQKEILGPGKWQLWKAEKLTLSDMVDQSGRPLTVAELQARYGGNGAQPPAPPREPRFVMTGVPVSAPQITPLSTPSASLPTAAKAPLEEIESARKHIRPKELNELPALPQTIDPFTTPRWGLKPGENWKDRTYGGVIFDAKGRVLLRSPRGQFGGYEWTWAKGHPEANDLQPATVAMREVLEETGHMTDIVGMVHGTFKGTTTTSNFFLMRSKGESPGAMDTETFVTQWATLDEARQLILKSKNVQGRNRDLAILDAAEESLEKVTKDYRKQKRAATPVPALDEGQFPASVDELKWVANLGGSTGAVKMVDRQGRFWVMKSGASPDHLLSEFAAEQMYRAAGAEIPASKVYETPSGPVKLGTFIEGTLLKDLTGDALTRARATISQRFVADALLADRDVIGMEADNIIVTRDGKAYRIDVGGSLKYRAQGALKRDFGPAVVELDSMRDAGLNPQTAAVFGRLSTAEIETQIRDIIKRRDEILSVTPDDLKPIIRQRIEALASKVTTGGFSDEFAEKVAGSRILGRTHIGDRDLVEDMSVLFWEEKDQQGQAITRAKLKLTESGSDAIVQTLRNDMAAVAPQSSSGRRVHPQDTFWPVLQDGLKTINYHLGDKQFNTTKVDAMKAAAAKLADLAHDAATREMATYYLNVVDKALEAMQTGVKTSLFQQYEPPKAGEPPRQGRRSKFAVEAPGLQWTSKIRTLGRATISGSAVHSIAQGYRIMDEGLIIDFVPWKNPDGSRSTAPYAFQGYVEISMKGAVSPATLNRVGETLRELGVDIAPAAAAYQELTYLRKGLEIRSYGLMTPAQNTKWRQIADGTDGDELKVKKLRQFIETDLKLKVPESSVATYQVGGYANAWGDGWQRWDRWDLTAEEIEKGMKGWGLIHSSTTNLGTLIESFLDGGGQVTSTTERLRTGIGIEAGMSSHHDMGTGGANYFFTRIAGRSRTDGHHGLVFKIGRLARADAFSFSSDVFGDVRPPGQNSHGIDPRRDRARTIEQFKEYGHGGGNETIFKWGLSLLEDIDRINCSTDTERTRILNVFKKHKIKTLPDGRKIEDVVKVI
jgi:hypothetical protein